MSGLWIGTPVVRVPQAPRLSCKTPVLWHAVNFHTSHLEPMHPSCHFCIKDLYSAIKQELNNSELLLAPRQKVSPLSLAGSICGVFSVSAPDKVTPCWAETLFIPSLQPDNLWIRTSACNKSLCLWLYQWFSAGAMVLPQCLEIFFIVKNGRWGMEGCHRPLMKIG